LFFPVLEALQKNGILPYDIRQLDSWLASRQPQMYNSLNPLQFSLDTEIRPEYAIHLFILCTYPKIKLLKPRAELSCPVCLTSLSTSDTFEPSSNRAIKYIKCTECHSTINVAENTLIWFSLLKDPIFSHSAEFTYSRKKAESLSLATAQKAVIGLGDIFDDI